MLRKNVVLLFFGISLLLLNACSTTTLKGNWKDASFQGRIHKVMVIGVTKNSVLRKIFETEFAEDIQARGVQAVPSFTLFPTEEQLNQEAVQAKARELNIDSIIVTKVLKHSKEQEQVTEVTGSPPVPHPYYRGYRPYAARPYYGSWYGDYSGSFRTVRSYTVEYNVVDLETSLYDLESGKPVWSAIFETKTQEANQKEMGSVIKVVVGQLVKDGLL